MQLMHEAHPSLGFALIEVLFALAILGLGLSVSMGWLQPHLQTQRQQLARETAMQLADNLAERMHLNPSATHGYAQSWGQTLTPSNTNCEQQACTAAQLAAWDVTQWRQEVQAQLPGGDAAVFTHDQQWWGIVLAWQDANERYRTDGANGSPACPAQHSCWRLWLRP
jgi:type IV pilus assembly protein PilV